MRAIDKIILHCSDSDNVKHDDVSIINQWHKEKGWNSCGYHYFIKKNGELQTGRFEDEIGAHCKGHNSTSIGVCLSGKTAFTEQQYDTAVLLVKNIMERYKLTEKDIYCHYQFDSFKTCPNFKIDLFKSKL